jgi:hypothetical protein
MLVLVFALHGVCACGNSWATRCRRKCQPTRALSTSLPGLRARCMQTSTADCKNGLPSQPLGGEAVMLVGVQPADVSEAAVYTRTGRLNLFTCKRCTATLALLPATSLQVCVPLGQIRRVVYSTLRSVAGHSKLAPAICGAGCPTPKCSRKISLFTVLEQSESKSHASGTEASQVQRRLMHIHRRVAQHYRTPRSAATSCTLTAEADITSSASSLSSQHVLCLPLPCACRTYKECSSSTTS